jgi:parallel beta-helix repeat protein
MLMNRKTLAPALILMLLACITSAVGVQPVKSQTQGTVYIMPDGSVAPADAPIIRKGDTYELTGNLLFSNAQLDYGLVIQRDNIVLDGAGFIIQKPLSQNWGIGINMTGRSNVTITNLSISQFGRGLKAENCSNIKIENTHITHVSNGMECFNSSNIEIIDNTITSPEPIDTAYGTEGVVIVGENSPYGKSSNFTISRNTITHEEKGVMAYDADYNVISWNNISGCETGMGIGSCCQVFANNLFDMVKNEGAKAGVATHHGTALSVWNENLVYANNFTGNGVGVRLNGAYGNVFYGNNFVDNQLSDVDLNSDVSPANAWDNGTYGNYWSNYKSEYPDAAEVDDTGTGNLAYALFSNNTDNHPLLNPISAKQALAITPPEKTEPLPSPPTTLVIAAAATAIILITAALLVYFKKRKR